MLPPETTHGGQTVKRLKKLGTTNVNKPPSDEIASYVSLSLTTKATSLPNLRAGVDARCEDSIAEPSIRQ